MRAGKKSAGRCEPTWFPSHRSFLSAAEADFTEDAEDVSFAQRPRVFSWTRASLVGGDLFAVGLSGLTLLSDQGAGDGRRHLPREVGGATEEKISEDVRCSVQIW